MIEHQTLRMNGLQNRDRFLQRIVSQFGKNRITTVCGGNREVAEIR